MADSTDATIEDISPYYGYIPSLSVTIIFTVLFTLSTSKYRPLESILPSLPAPGSHSPRAVDSLQASLPIIHSHCGWAA